MRLIKTPLVKGYDKSNINSELKDTKKLKGQSQNISP